MIRILLGGSPCTKFSIAQKNDRETQPNSGIGWELFKNYLIAKEKFKPDYFLYENNKSAAQPIKYEIKKQFRVRNLFNIDSDVEYIEINSALVSAQNRERFYVHNCGEVGQPKDRGILLKDVLESGLTDKDKSYCLKHQAGNSRDYFKKHHTQVAFERIPEYGKEDKSRPLIAGYASKGDGEGSLADKCFTENPNKQKVDYVAEPIPIQTTAKGKAYGIKAQYVQSVMANFLTNGGYQATGVAEPIRVGAMPRSNGELSTSQGMRIYSIDGKSVTQSAQGGGWGAKTGLYAVPLEKYNYATEFDSDGKPTKAYCYADGKIHTVYEVKDGKITIKGKEYPIKLPDGFYIIRKLTVAECRRLQTIPDWYQMPCSDTQNYKMLGNGWTIEVIKHILSHIPNITTESIEVLSMYDGMSCGQIALKELGANVVKYYATEIDKYAIQTTQTNFPDTVQLGDAFQVRDENWNINSLVEEIRK